ncbi:hypothetical protein [Planctomycetes bacterium K23_9]|uniref:Uncharacterized protein n=1 Tax=Stieleria marina TaxID=1930275 RepID=A0A517NRU6_9BACT|nr:hypothetical protein K239x_18100 [Planctomycetes bacterium K23_9]
MHPHLTPGSHLGQRVTSASVLRHLCAGLLCAGSFIAIQSNSIAQDAFVDADTAVEVQPDSPVDDQVIQLNQMAAQGGTSLGTALNAFTRINRWSDADRWLQNGVSGVNDPAELAGIAKQIGADNLLRLATSDQISADAKKMVEKLGQAAQKFAESKSRLAQAIDGLDADSVDQRLESARRLLTGGNAAVAALVAAAVSESPTAPREEILRAMLKISESGRQAIEQLAIYGQGSVRARATGALTRIDRKSALPDLLTALYGADSTPEEKSFAQVNLPPLTQTLPTLPEAKGVLFTELNRQRRRAQDIENGFDTVTLWSIGADRKSVNFQSVRTVIGAYRGAVDAASRLRRVGGLSRGMLDAVLASQMGYRVMIDPDWGTVEQMESIDASFADQVGEIDLSDAIALSLKNQDYPAAIGLMRLIGRSNLAGDVQGLLFGSQSKLSVLVGATLHGEPRVRYEAAAAIARLNPPSSFAGSSHFIKCLAEMRDLQNLPLVLLVETRAEVALQQELILSKMGFQTEVVGAVLDLERCVARGGDLRMILSKTQLWDIPPVEMIDRVRRLPKGQNVPIVFYNEPIRPSDPEFVANLVDDEEEDEFFAKPKPPVLHQPIVGTEKFSMAKQIPGLESDRWNAPSRQIPMPRTPAAFTNLFLDLDLVNRLPELTAIDRQQFRKTAMDYLSSVQ